jgi:hypothetical protein
MANPIDDLHAVFAMCGINDDATRGNIIVQEGFTQLEDLGVLENDTDVSEMAKRMATRTQAEGRVLLGTVVIKRLQTLVWWVRDQQKRGLTLNAADFDIAAMTQASEMKTLRRERAEKEPSITDLGKFDPDDFDSHEDAFLNLLAQSFGVLREPLRYIVRPENPPAEFATMEEERMFQFPLTGGSFELDNQTVFRKLKAFLIDSPGWAWIEPHDTAENGRAAYMAWTDHYNGEGELSKRTSLAKSKLDTLHYKNERSMSFERCTEIMTKCFTTLHKDVDQRYSDRQKVEKLLKAIRCSDPELLAAKAIIDQTFTRDFVGACGYFSQQVARIHGPAQLEYRQNRSRKRHISAVDRQAGRGGRGRGRHNGRGRHGGRGRGRGRGSGNTNINGVNIGDPNRSFTSTEWEALGPTGRTAVLNMRDRTTQGRGGREGRGRGRVSFQDDQRNVSSTAIVEYTNDNAAIVEYSNASGAASHQQSDNSTITSERGGRNGRGFGRGAYGRGGGGRE